MIIAPVMVEAGPVGHSRPFNGCTQSERTLIVDYDVGTIDQLFTGGVRRFRLLAMRFRQDRNHRQSTLLGAHRHFDDYGVDPASGNYDEGVIFSKTKAAKDLLGVAFVIFKIKRRSESIRTDDSGMVRERQFEECHKTWKAALSGRHLCAEHSRVTVPKQKYQATTSDPVGA
jgi:hypothetical protein